MVSREVIINRTVDFINSKLSILSSSNPAILFFRPLIARAINNNIEKLDKILKLIQDKDGNIDVEGIMSEMVDNLITAKSKSFKEYGLEIGDGQIKVNIPITNKAIVFNTDDIETFKQFLIKQ